MFEIPKYVGEAVPKKESEEIAEKKEKGPKEEYAITVQMEGIDRTGKPIAEKKSEISKLTEVVKVEATSEEEAIKIALGMDFGNKKPDGFVHVKKIEAEKEVIENKTVPEKLKEEAMEVIKRGLRERQRPLKPDELKIVAPNLRLFSEDAQEIIIAAFGGGISTTLAEAEQKSTRKKSKKE